jgi:hypothetical protein
MKLARVAGAATVMAISVAVTVPLIIRAVHALLIPAAIHATVRSTTGELDRIAAEANGEIIESTAIEERFS